MESDSKHSKRDVHNESLSWLWADEDNSDEAIEDDGSSFSGSYSWKSGYRSIRSPLTQLILVLNINASYAY